MQLDLFDRSIREPLAAPLPQVQGEGEGWSGEEFWRLVKRAEEAGEVHSEQSGKGMALWFPGKRGEAKR